MAKRRNKKDPFDYIRLPSLDLDSDIKKGIFIIFVLALGAISLLGLFNLAGALGIYLAKGLIYLFGWGKWSAPILLLFWGYMLYREEEFPLRGANYLGAFLFIISFQSILHLFIDKNEWQSVIALGSGGGAIGLFFISIFIKLLGLWASIIVLIALLLIGLMLLFNTTLKSLVGRERGLAKLFFPFFWVLGKIFKKREDGEEESDGDEENEEEEKDVEESKEEEDEDENEDDKNDLDFTNRRVKNARNEKISAQKSAESNLWKKSNIQINLPLELLNGRIGKPTGGDIKANMAVIQKTLENFNIPVEMGEVLTGPTFTQYTFKPADGIMLSKITNLNNNLALALAAHPIRIEAPIPGKSLVGIEVPNHAKAIVGLKEILSDVSFKNRKNNMYFALGKDVSGKVWVDDLTKMPHILVAGATNSGKSVCLHSIIASILYQNNPDDLRFIMVDPKRVELPVYNGIPHLLAPVITDIPRTINALKWCINEMEKRLEMLEYSDHTRNIQEYNKRFKDKLPYLVFIIDELADLMVLAAKDVESCVIRLAQKGRAAGIHLILATQDPRAEVVTGLIKANMPTRIAFSVTSGVNSRIILDTLGAEKLLGRGDMLYLSSEMAKPRRLQGAFVSTNEVKNIIEYIKEKGGEPSYIESITERQKVPGMSGGSFDNNSDIDDMLEEAKEEIINSGKASASFLQRRLRIGYARAASILDQLEQAGVIGPSNGAKPREIFISKEQYEAVASQGISGVSLHKMEESEAPDNYLGEEEESSYAEASEDEDEDEDGEDEKEEENEEENDEEKEKDDEDSEDDENVEDNNKKNKPSNNSKPTFDKFYSR